MKTSTPYQIIEQLKTAGIPFVVIGGLSVIHHGYIRSTEAADIVFKRGDASNDRALLDALSKINACWIGDEIDPSTGLERLVPVSPAFIKAEHLMMLCTNFGFLDAYDHIPGHPGTPVDELFKTADERDGILFSSLDWLLRMKKAAGRDKDKDDITKLTLLSANHK